MHIDKVKFFMLISHDFGISLGEYATRGHRTTFRCLLNARIANVWHPVIFIATATIGGMGLRRILL